MRLRGLPGAVSSITAASVSSSARRHATLPRKVVALTSAGVVERDGVA
jgi:hypothetical protein